MSRTPDYIQSPRCVIPKGKSIIITAMLLAADVGGTKTLLGLFKEAPERPDTIEAGEVVTLDYDSLVPMIREFLKAEGVEPRAITAASFGVAGAVTDQVARLTNAPRLGCRAPRALDAARR